MPRPRLVGALIKLSPDPAGRYVLGAGGRWGGGGLGQKRKRSKPLNSIHKTKEAPQSLHHHQGVVSINLRVGVKAHTTT